MTTYNNNFKVRFGLDVAEKITAAASTTTRAGLNLPHGTAPSGPVDGDIWTTTAGLYARINGSTVGPLGSGGTGSAAFIIPLTVAGAISTGTGKARIPVPYNCTITGVQAMLHTASSSGSVVVDVNINGTTIWSTQANRPTIAASSNDSGKVTNMNTTSVTTGQYFTVDIDSAGTGADTLTVTLFLDKA